MRNKRAKRMAIALVFAVCGYAGSSQAASISYYLNQTNVDSGALIDGTSFGLVTIEDTVPGTLRFTVSLLTPLTSIAGSNFGIDSFAFNVVGVDPLQDSGSIAGQWTFPAGWSANVAPPTNQSDGFGRFDVAVDGSGSARVTILMFDIHNASLNLASFAEASTNNAGQGNVFFSAHVAGFNGPAGITSGYVGGSTIAPVPLPAALPLLLSALGGLGLTFRRRAV